MPLHLAMAVLLRKAVLSGCTGFRQSRHSVARHKEYTGQYVTLRCLADGRYQHFVPPCRAAPSQLDPRSLAESSFKSAPRLLSPLRYCSAVRTYRSLPASQRRRPQASSLVEAPVATERLLEAEGAAPITHRVTCASVPAPPSGYHCSHTPRAKDMYQGAG